MKLLHVIKNTVTNPIHKYLGSTKDIRGRTQYFENRKVEYDEIYFEGRKAVLDRKLLKKIKTIDLSSYEAVFCEYPIYVRSLFYLRRNYPHLKLIVRSHNAEFYHLIHYFIATYKMHHYKLALSHLRHSFFRLYQDFLCGCIADYICSISDWESSFYWSLIAKSGKIIDLPFFLPDSYLEEIGSSSSKKKQVVCLSSSTLSPFVIDAANNFVSAVNASGERLSDWRFVVTGDIPPEDRLPTTRVQYCGLLASPFQVLNEAVAVATLSDYGFGFKTKILEAIVSKCYSLVTPKLFHRLPEQLKPFCLVVQPESPSSFEKALLLCLEPFPDIDCNALLRASAFRSLDRVLYNG
jgi:hypothetical protein